MQLVRVPQSIGVREAIRRYRLDPTVQYAEPNYILHALATPNDPSFNQLWNLQNTGQLGGVGGADIHALQAWNITTGSANVVVAVIDTGFDYNHPDLAANVWSSPTPFSTNANGVSISCAAGTHGYNAITGICDPMDDNDHGTHVSGIIGAVGNNGTGVVGVNWNVQLVACKFLNQYGTGNISDAITCLDYIKALKDNGVNIVASNNSWGGIQFSQALSDTILAQQQDGILFVAASGNDFSNNDLLATYPASFDLPNLISVAATTRFDTLANFSNVGTHSVHLGAPGQEILSTTPNNTYSVFSGTSMAAPEVTGVAALLAAQNPAYDWRTIKNLILTGGDPNSALNQTITGRRLDAFGSMTCSTGTAQSRLQPVPSVIAGAVGTPIKLEDLAIKCGQPNGPVQVTVSPGGTVVNLVDDGSNGDVGAGDGVFSGSWTPPAQGNYTLTFPGGDMVSVEILANYTPSSTTYTYVSITGTNLNLDDDSVATVQSPFPINLGGGSFSTLYVNSNGTVSFTEAFDGYLPQPLPQQLPSSGNLFFGPPFFSMVAPFWQDLYPIPNTSQNVFWAVAGSAPNRQLVVEWRNVLSFDCSNDQTANVTFEAVFNENSSDVQFNYANAAFGGYCANEDHGAAASVGIQTSPGTGAQWSFLTQDIGDSTSILWQLPSGTTPPPNPVPSITTLSPSSAQLGSAGLTITVTGANFVPQSRVQWRGSDRVTTYISSTQLKAVITAIDLSGPPNSGVGGNPVTVGNPAPGGGTSNSGTFTIVAPPSTITSISPSSAVAGSFSFRLSVNGTNFQPGSQIYWNGAPLQLFTIQYSANLVVGGIFQNQLTTPGTVPVTVVAPDGSRSNPATFTIQPAPPGGSVYLRQQPVGIPNGTLPPSVSSLPNPPYEFLGWKYAMRRGGEYLARFMRARANAMTPAGAPGAASIASAMYSAAPQTTSPGALSVPGFLLPRSLPANFIPASVAVGDFNGDGNLDWVIANAGSNDLWIYFGKGDGTASLPIIIPLRGQTPLSVTSADLRRRGVLDLIVAEADSGTVEVLLGSGNGTFGTGALYYAPGPPLSVAAGDFDGDGMPDVLVGMFDAPTTGSLALLPGDGTGHLGMPRMSPVTSIDPTIAAYLSVADLNGDGRPDVVLVNQFNTELLSFVNKGDGTFKQAQTVMGTSAPGQFLLNVALGDLNGDGCPDAVVTDTFADAYVFPGNCDGTFQRNFAAYQFSEYGVGDTALGVALADVNHDGKLDLVTSGFVLSEYGFLGQIGGNIISVLFGDGSGGFSSPQLYRGEASMVGLAVADLNKDGFPDLITANQDSDSAGVFLNDGKGGFGSDRGSYVGWISGSGAEGVINAPISNFVPSDFNGDGKLDLAFLEYGQLYPDPVQLTILLNNGNGTFSPASRYAVADAPSLPIYFKFGDFRNTGHPDFLAVGDSLTSSLSFVSFAPNNGNGTFGPAVTTSFPAGQVLLALGDFNGDGRLDFVDANGNCAGGSVCLTTFLGNGDGTFRQAASLPLNGSSTIGAPGSLYAGDFNKDGKLDLLFAPQSLFLSIHGDLLEFLGNGNGTFQLPVHVLQNVGPVALADLNHDGLFDIVEASQPASIFQAGSTSFNIYLGQPDGTFVLINTYAPFNGVFGNYLFGPGLLTDRTSPMVADFNGDGNPDIAAFQLVPGGNQITSLQQAYLQILLGNGDGSFTPSYNTDQFHKAAVPNNVADVNGDGRADLIELDHYSSSFDVVPATAGPAFQIGMEAVPVVGSRGGVVVTLSLPSSSPTTISLAASDPAVSISSSVTIPAGTVSQLIPFQIGASFNASHVFSIQGQLGTEVEIAYGFRAAANSGSGFVVLAANLTEGVLPGQTSLDYLAEIVSVAGYSSILQLSCAGLPVGFTCQFGENPFSLAAGHFGFTSLNVTAPLNAIPGTYPFAIVAKDAAFAQQMNLTLTVGDFQLQLQPASQSALSGDTLAYNLTIASVNGYNQSVDLRCSKVPSGVGCSVTTPAVLLSAGSTTTGTVLLAIPASLPQATYSFNVVGAAAQTSHTVVGQFTVGSITGSISPTSATINVGTQGTFAFTLNSQNGYTGKVSLQCAPSANYFCFSDVVTLPANGSASGQLIMSVTGKPPRANANSTSSTISKHERTSAVIILSSMFFAGVCFLPGLKNQSRFRKSILACATVWLLLAIFASCGGGSGGTGSGGGGGGGGGGAPTTVQVPITAQSATGGTNPIATLSITVP